MRLRRRILNIISFIGLFNITLLVGCSTTSSVISQPDGATQAPAAQSAESVKHWEMDGAMAAKSDSKGWSASFYWTQQGLDNYIIRLFGPLGNGTTVISHKQGVTTFQRGQETASSGNAEQLLHEKTGVHFPVTDLYYWARCLPAPSSKSTLNRDANHHVVQIQQAGFIVECTQYTRIQQVDLPKHIKVTGPHVSLKIIIKNWKL